MRADCFPVGGLKTLVLLLLILYEGHTIKICNTGMQTDNNNRAQNEDQRGQPLYWFDLHEASDGYHPGHHYTLKLHTSANASPFSDAVLKLETVNSCGTGVLNLNSTYLYQPRHCPQMIMTDNKQPMTHIPFKWTAPSCGCVTFRATVIRNGEAYYYDEDKVTDGNLVKTVCPQGVRLAEQLLLEDELTTQSTTHVATPMTPKMTRAARLDLLCKITHKLNVVTLLQRQDFLQRRKLQNSTLVKLLNIELALEQRRADVSSCCQKSAESKVTCFSNIRRHRIDQLCGDGSPRIPFTTKKSDFMNKREADCCWKIGESRYRCFNKSNDKSPLDIDHYSMDFSLDESDPVNDISDYPTEVEKLEKDFNTHLFYNPLNLKNQRNRKPEESSVIATTPSTTTPATTVKFNIITSTTPFPATKWGGPPPFRYSRVGRRPAPTVSALRESRQDGQGDMGYKSMSKKSVPPIQVAATSSVELTMNSLRSRLWKSSLKFGCCQQGQTFAMKTAMVEIWGVCRKAAKVYRGSIIRGKRTCSKSFHKCCVEQFLSTASDIRFKGNTKQTVQEETNQFDDDHKFRNGGKESGEPKYLVNHQGDDTRYQPDHISQHTSRPKIQSPSEMSKSAGDTRTKRRRNRKLRRRRHHS